MTKSLNRLMLAVAGAALLAVSAVPAAAATLTYNDPNCAGFQITGTAGSFTLTCAKIQCSISGVTTPSTAQDTTLTANCSPTPAGYTWTLLTGPFSDPTCNAPSTPTAQSTGIVKPGGIVAGQSRACLYQVTASAPPLSGQSMVTVTWADSAIIAPSGCSLVANPSSLPVGGGNVTLTASCSGGSPPTSYAWTGPGVATPTTSNTQIVNVTASTTFGVTPSNAGGPGNTATAPVTVSSGGGPVSCPGFAKTVNIDIGYPASGTSWQTQSYGGFNSNDALVVRIAVPAGVASLPSTAGSISTVEYVDPAAYRYATLSTTACDWSGTPGYTIPVLWTGVQGVGPSLQVGRKDYSSMVQLNAGTVYYLNMKNTAADGVTPTCSGGCNININWTRPPGT